MRLTWEGTLYGHPANGFVEAGACFGTFEVVSQVEAFVSAGVRVGLGPWSGPASLSDARAARATIGAVLDAGSTRFEGWEVPVEQVPEGAEA